MPEGRGYPDRLQELIYPTKGVDVTQEFGEQPDGTAVDEENMRPTDADGRDRGGTRPGAGRYIEAQSPEGAHLIQHLNLIVDPTVDALPINFDDPGEDWTENPLIPGQYVPPGGTGNQPNPNADTPEPPQDIAFVQAKEAQANGSGPVQVSITFDATVTIDNDVLLFVGIFSTEAGCEVAVVNDVGTALTQVGGYFDQEQLVGSGSFTSISLWRIRATAVGNTTLKVTPTKAAAFVSMVALEYSGFLNPLPLDDTEGTTDPDLGPADMRVESLTISGNDGMAIAGFCNTFDPTAGWTVGAGQTSRGNIADTATGPALRVTDKFPVSASSSPLTLTGDVDGGDTPYVAIGASFKKSS